MYIKSFKSTDTNTVINNRKENHFFESYMVFAHTERGGIQPVVEVRLYHPGGAKMYACVWVRDAAGNFSAAGANCSGWGYDKQSEASALALKAAGVVFEDRQSPAGKGMNVVQEAIEELARFNGYTVLHTFNAHA